MKIKLSLITVLAASLSATAAASASVTRKTATTINGAGSSLVAPLISQWVPEYGSKTGVKLTYNPIGSGGGIAAITARTVDFGASDAPLTPDQMTNCKGCIQIPWALSATTLSYNVPGAPNDLHLTGPVIADIFLGNIKNWNDPRIQSLNPKVNLPDLAITPAYRSDGSGDTYAFTDYLSRVSPAWKSKVGNATSVNFPAGVGGRGNSGVAGVIANTKGAIGYISVAYTLSNHLYVAAIKNKAGAFATPGLRGISAAAAAFKTVGPNNEMHIVNPPAGKKTKKGYEFKLAYPISTYTYVIVPTASPKAAELRRFIFYGLTQGQKFGPKLIFAKLPLAVLVAAEKTLKKIHT
jgi:phosphate transport system substrate-binding protein